MKQSSLQKESLGKAAKYYAAAIHEAEDYLAERGITLEVARRVGLGVVLDPITGHEQYENRLSIPYITRSGVVDIRFRSLDAQEPKYMGLAGGDTAVHEFSKSLTKELGNVVTVQMPEGEDVNSMYLKHGAEYFQQKIRNSQ